MGAEHLAAMEITVEQAQDAVDFLEAYGEFSLRELEEQWSVQERTSGGGEVSLAGEDRSWTLRVDAASSFREAGQWALCFDPARARQLLDRAGSLFFGLGHAFGAYLRVVAGPWSQEPPIGEFRDSLDGVAYLSGLPTARRDIAVPAPLRHPQQQAYLVVASAGSPGASRELGGRLREILANSPHRTGVVPVGALGTPIRRYWQMAQALLADVAPDY